MQTRDILSWRSRSAPIQSSEFKGILYSSVLGSAPSSLCEELGTHTTALNGANYNVSCQALPAFCFPAHLNNMPDYHGKMLYPVQAWNPRLINHV